jgi:hypothetical protein
VADFHMTIHISAPAPPLAEDARGEGGYFTRAAHRYSRRSDRNRLNWTW